MPLFNTGEAQWDQGLNTLAQGLFPDPSNMAKAGYYGAEARKAQIDAAKEQEQLRAGHAYLNAVSGQRMNPTYSPVGPLGITIMDEPAPMTGDQSAPPPAAPGGQPPPLSSVIAPTAPAGGPPPAVAAPPSTAAGGPPPAAVPPPVAAAPAAGTVGANLSPGSLGNLVAQGGGPVQPNPAALADAVATGLDKSPGAPGPDVSSPAPGTPPAPNTTGSDGSVPVSKDNSIIHPGSLTPPGGGTKYSPPAAADGSPAPAAINMGQLAALGVLKGMPADQIQVVGRQIVAGWIKNGQMDPTSANQVLKALGQPEMATQEIAQAGATTRTGMEVAGRQAVANAEIAGREKVAGMPATFVPDENDPTKGANVPLSQLQGPGGMRGYNPNAVSEAIKPTEVQPGGPGTPTFNQPTFQAQRNQTPTYQSVQEQQQGAPGQFIDPKNPTQLLPATFAQAQQLGLVPVPKTPEEWNALAASAAANAKTPEEAQAIRDKVLQFGQTTQQKPADAVETLRNQNIVDSQLEKAFPVPAGWHPATNKNPAAASPEAGTTLSNLTDEYFRNGGPTVRGDRIASTNAAIQQLVRQKYIDPSQDRSAYVSNASTSITKSILQKSGQIVPQTRFRIDIKDPTTGKVAEAGHAPVVHMEGAPSLANTVAPNNTPVPPAPVPPAWRVPQPASVPPVPQAPAPQAGTPIAMAPPNSPDGARAQLPDGRVGVVRSGKVYAQ